MKQKILLITNNYPPIIGGVETYSYDLYQSLKSKTKVDLIANRKGKKYYPFFIIYSFFKAVIKQKDYSHIHLCSGVLAPLIPLFQLLKNKKISITIHGLDITWENYFYQKTIPFLLKKADAIVTVSQYTKKICLKKGLPKNKIRVIPNSINYNNPSITISKAKWMKKYHIQQNSKQIITVGRLIKRKGVKIFIKEVISKIKTPNFQYHIIGSGPEINEIKNTIKNLGLTKKCHLHGKIADRDLKTFYQNCDIFVMPNIEIKGDIEGFGIVCIEASREGLLVLGSGIQGTKDAIINNKTGLFYKNYQEAKKIIEDICNNRLQLPKKSEIAETTRKNFSWKENIKSYITMFAELNPLE